ncbi:MAG: outer membrane lipoprotein-sorting protein [Candidatus Bipolaricaulia bacterium]
MRTWISVALVLLGLLLSLGGPSGAAQGPTAEELVRGVDRLLRADSNIMQIEMDVTTPDYQRTDVLKAYMEGEEKALIKLISPEEERGTGWLKLGEELWMYIPSIDQLMKIPPTMMMESFRGSTFSYDDLVKESSIVRDYTPQIIDTESRGGMAVYVLELDPKPDAPVVYGKILLWVREDFIPVKQEFYDEEGTALKVTNYREIEELGGRTIPTVWVTVDLLEDHHVTTFVIMSAEFDVEIDPEVFTLEYLKDPSRF